MAHTARGDLVIVALSGVQRFIAESRTTRDLHAGSKIIERLAAEAATTLVREQDVELVFPTPNGRPDTDSDTAAGMPNRLVALAPDGRGPEIARRVEAAVRQLWRKWVRQALDGREVDTPGMPAVHWVCVSADAGDDYGARWSRARVALDARRRVRDFPAVDYPGRRLCTLSPRWPAEEQRPRRAPAHERDLLSAANWVKRLWRYGPGASTEDRQSGFPSTNSIASAPFRAAVLRRLDEPKVRSAVRKLRQAVDAVTRARETPIAGLRELRTGDALADWFAAAGGNWVHAGAWEPVSMARNLDGRSSNADAYRERAEKGRQALLQLVEAMAPGLQDPEPPGAYLALVAQDLDGLGRFLGGADGRPITADSHRETSRRLVDLAKAQVAALSHVDVLGVPVYAGGDDLLAFSPAATALTAAREVHRLVPSDTLPTASTAVLFFHSSSSLQRAVTGVRQLLADAKAAHPNKHALGVGFLRRSGVRASSIQPWHPLPPGGLAWDGTTSADLFEMFTRTGPKGRRLSPRLVTELERDEFELSHLPEDVYRAELSRLVARHGGDADDAKALLRLGMRERGTPKRAPGVRTVPAAAARVAVFLRQECRQVTW